FSAKKIAPAVASFNVNPSVYEKEVSKARTFGFKSELKWLKLLGLIKGASLENSILMDNGKPVAGSLRYPDELTRHKMLDIIGDFGLLNGRLKAHIIAVKTGHKQNVEMVKKLKL
ncbi:MAG: UDP-3-O-acyl-N-acetylglucosamine deacetylase, partial [Spirochaetia bacterium]|nr:UDP-3-O-acyl-N-acetylglucosamine deacetylase [Spirochaetia bacterium]